MKHISSFSCLILLSLKLLSQHESDPIFDNSIVHEVRIDFQQENFWEILEENSFEEDIPYIEANVNIDGESVEHVGVRLKGFTSLGIMDGYKKPLKLDFNEFNDTLSFRGLKKLNLNNSFGDPSYQRDPLSYYLLRKAGVAAPRTSYANVYLNDTYWGLYIMVEQVDKSFLERNFVSDKGNLYKATGWCTLDYSSDNFNDYAGQIELRTNRDSDGRDYVHLVKSIDHLSDQEFADSVQKMFYVDYFFKTLSLDIILKNWDSFMQHGRNFYLYHEPVSDLFYWIPWDYNFCMGGDFFFDEPGMGDTCEINIDFTFDIVDTTLYYSVKFPRDNFSELYLDFGDFSTSFYLTEIEDTLGVDTCLVEGEHKYLKEGIYSLSLYVTYGYECWINRNVRIALMDTTGLCPSIMKMDIPYFPDELNYDTVFATDDFCCCNWDMLCDQIKYQIESNSVVNNDQFPIDYLSERILIQKLFYHQKFKDKYFDIFKYVLDSVFIEEDVIQFININADLIRESVYADTNALYSTEQFENEILASCETDTYYSSITRQLEHRKGGLDREYGSLNYQAKPVQQKIEFNNVVINELAADATDDEGNKIDDWIELYNNTNDVISLDGFWLSDDYDTVSKFCFPVSSAIKPDGYLIVWADKKEKKNNLHAPFKLSKEGEEVILFHDDYHTIDSICFGAQIEDSTLARYPNGTGPFVRITPTFNAENRFIIIPSTDDPVISKKIIIYPNPASSILIIQTESSFEQCSVVMHNTLGQLVYQSESSTGYLELNVSDLQNGMYFLRVETSAGLYSAKVLIYH